MNRGWQISCVLAPALALFLTRPMSGQEPQVPLIPAPIEAEPPAPVKPIATTPKSAQTPKPPAIPIAPTSKKGPVKEEPVTKPSAPAAVTMPTEQDSPAATTEDDRNNNHVEQVVALEWIGPNQIKVGQPFVYEIIVRNNGVEKLTDVMVRDRIPEGVKVATVEPKPVQDSEVYLWNLGTLEPRQESRIRIEMVASKRGEITCQATVTATSPALAKLRVSEPQVAVKQDVPEKSQIGEPTTFTIAVTNPGDGPADNVVVRTTMSAGLKHDQGDQFTYEIGTLGPGETRSVQVVCEATKGGEQNVKTLVTAEGGLEAATESKTLVTEPKLEIAMGGPKLRYLDRQAVYTVTVKNPGDSPANNVKLAVNIPGGFKYASSTNGGRHESSARTINWFLGSLAAGEKREVQYTCVAAHPGQQKHTASAAGQRGVKADSEIVTNVEGISALLLEVIDVDDPVETGSDTAYEIRITNQGSREATNVEIHCLIPKEMQVKGGQGPTNYRIEGQEIIFAPLAKLAPRADAIYRVFVKGIGVGDVRFRARLVSDSLTEPVIEEESTKIYQD